MTKVRLDLFKDLKKMFNGFSMNQCGQNFHFFQACNFLPGVGVGFVCARVCVGRGGGGGNSGVVLIYNPHCMMYYMRQCNVEYSTVLSQLLP